MKKIFNKNIRLFILLGVLVLMTSCQKVVVVVNELPSNTPEGASLYIAGNFNFWDPGNESYQLQLKDDSTYFIALPKVFGRVEYKFTRGDWTTVEKNRCGVEIADRLVVNRNADTVFNAIESWADLDPVDCDSVTIVVTNVPKDTPIENLKVAGNFNAWNPGENPNYVLQKSEVENAMVVTIPVDSSRSIEEIAFKIVRGEEEVSEADEFGKQLEKRKLDLSKDGKVYVEVESWEDQKVKRLNTVTIILTKVPENTPAEDDLYLVGNFNGWYPGDREYLFNKLNNGQYTITIPRRNYGLSFKVTRGDWDTEAADRYGYKLNNQDYNYDEIDTLHIEIDNWLDRSVPQKNRLTIILNSIPENTPEGSTVYLAGTFNKWDPNDREFVFSKNEEGLYTISIESEEPGVSFKITRGRWSSEAADSKGDKYENTNVKFTGDDTVRLEIPNWADLPLSE